MKEEISRRKLFATVGRWAALAGLAGLVGKSGLDSVRHAPTERGNDVCARCPGLTSCELPGAVRTRGDLNVALGAGEPKELEGPGLCGWQIRSTKTENVKGVRT